MKNILMLSLTALTLILLSLSYGCSGTLSEKPVDPCELDSNIPSINHIWTLYEGREIQQMAITKTTLMTW